MPKYIFIVFIVISGILFVKNKKHLIYLYLLALPFFGLQVDWGLQVDFSKILSFAMFIYVVSFLKFPRKLSPIVGFLLYIIFITVVMSMFLPESAKEFPLLRGEYRWVSQVFMWLLIFAPIFYSQILRIDEKTIERLYKVLLISLVIISFLGFVQIFCFYFLNFDPFPLGFFVQGDSERMAGFQYGEIFVFRMTSFGGEPKYLAYSLVMGLTILFPYLINKKIFFGKKLDIFIFIFLFAALFSTLSTQGYVLFFLNFIVLLIYFKRVKIVIVFFLFLIPFAIVVASFFGISLYDLIQLRLFRGEESISLATYTEDFNEAIIGFLTDYPEFMISGVGLGNIHLWAQDYIPDYAAHYMTGNVFCAKSGFLRVLSELGIFGTGLFFYAFLKPFSHFKKYSKTVKLHFIISFLIFFDFLLSMNGPIYITFAFIIVYSLYDSLDINNAELINKKKALNL